MIWLVWRRRRVALVAACGLVAAVAALAAGGRLYWLADAGRRGVLPCLGDP